MIIPNIWKKMFQTTNQSSFLIYFCSLFFKCANECFRILHRRQVNNSHVLCSGPSLQYRHLENNVHSQWRIFVLPGLVNIQETMERSTMVHGKINYFDWAMASSLLC